MSDNIQINTTGRLTPCLQKKIDKTTYLVEVQYGSTIESVQCSKKCFGSEIDPGLRPFVGRIVVFENESFLHAEDFCFTGKCCIIDDIFLLRVQDVSDRYCHDLNRNHISIILMKILHKIMIKDILKKQETIR